MKHIFLIILIISCFPVLASSKCYDFIVDQQGGGDYTSVQEAIDAVPHLRKNKTRILIKKGIYKEKLILSSTKTNISLIGEDLFKTVLTFDDYASKLNSFGEEMGTSGSSSFYVFGDGFRAENITFQNSSGPVGQAVAVRVDGDQIVFINCRFLGFQDTLYPHGDRSRQYYKDCYIEGTTDFIFGWSAAVFEDCVIFSKKGGHYITAASTNEGAACGFVFVNCVLKSDAPDQTVYLGRPWRPYAHTVFIHCEMDSHIHPEGWHNWSKPEAEKTTYYAEYQSSGAGADAAARALWSYQLSIDEITKYSLKKIFNGWIPNEESDLNF